MKEGMTATPPLHNQALEVRSILRAGTRKHALPCASNTESNNYITKNYGQTR